MNWFCQFSNRLPWKALVPLLEMVVISLTPPNSAVLLISLTRISAMPSNDGNSSAMGAPVLALEVLRPSRVMESIEGLLPATEILPAASVITPGCVIKVVIGLVEPPAREAIATGRSISSRPTLVSAILDTSVWTVVSVAVTVTDSACAAIVKLLSTRAAWRARSSKPVTVDR